MEKAKRNMKIIICMAILFLILAGIMAFRVFMQPNLSPINENWKSYREYLSKAEQKEWDDKSRRIKDNYAQISQRITIDQKTGTALVHYVNPLYGANLSKLSLRLEEDEEIILYESEQISPGTVIETVKVQESLDVGKYNGHAYFEFYTDQKKLLSEHNVALEIVVQ